MSQSAVRTVVLVVFPGVQLLDLAGPLDVFDTANRLPGLRRNPPYRLVVAGPTEQVATSGGLSVVARPFASVRGPVDTLIVAGALDFPARSFPPAELRWLKQRAARARRVVSVCAGAFVLARLGLLDGRRATTHWLTLDALRRQVPTAQVEGDPIYVRDGRVATSAGVTSGIDLALALVEEDLGHEVALRIAQALVVFLHRPGGQSQFSAALGRRRPARRALQEVQAAVAADPAGDHRVEALAERAHMSPRHFSRVFREQVGVAPGEYVRQVRVEAARQLLEDSELGLEGVAARCGLGTAESLRRAFLATLGITPGAYRRRFGRCKV